MAFSRRHRDEHRVDVGGVTIIDIVASGEADLFDAARRRWATIVIAGHAPENLGFRARFQLPIGPPTFGGRPRHFDKSFV